MRRWLAIGVLVTLAACERQQPASNATLPVPTPTPTHPVPAATSATGSAELPAPELDGVAIAPGTWRFQVSADGDQAVFGDAGEASEFAMRCDPGTRQMVFSRAPSGGSGATMQIVAKNGAVTLYTSESANGRAQASEPATNTFLTNVLATAKDRIGVRVGDGATLAMPVDPVIRQTILRCAAPKG